MTVKELSQLYYLNKEVKLNQEKLEQLENEITDDKHSLECIEVSAISPSTPKYNGMPKGSLPGNKLESNVIRISALKERIDRKQELRYKCKETIDAKQILCLKERDKLEKYIAELPTSLLRLIFTYRFVDGMTWAEVSDSIDFVKTTEESVKKMCYRYLDEQKKKVCPECP